VTLRSLNLHERAIARLVADGLTAAAIADRLGLSVYSVQHRIAHAAEKVGGVGDPKIKLTRWWCLVGLPEAEARLQALAEQARAA
jgi:DNA-binding NarL/FixJ family response regulator